MASEFEIIQAYEQQRDACKQTLMAGLRQLHVAPRPVTAEQLDAVHAQALLYFNGADRFVRDCRLLQAAHDPQWICEVAQDSATILDSMLIYYKMLRLVCEQSGVDYSGYIPTAFAYSNLQTLVRSFLDFNLHHTLRCRFNDLKLPVSGFDPNAPRFSPLSEKQDNADVTGMSSLRELRRELKEKYPLSEDLYAFVYDYFSDTHGHITMAMTQAQLLNVLFECASTAEIGAALRRG